MSDSRTELTIGDLNVIHGYLSKLGDHSKKLLSSVAVGHSHTGGVVFFKYRNNILFELNCGHLADESALPMQYTATRTKSWTHGYGIIEVKLGKMYPRFVPIVK